MGRKVAFIVGVVAAVGIGGGWVASGGVRFSSHKSPYHLEKARVERGDVTGRVTATGTLSALVTVQVGSQVSGRISDLNADFGSRVRRGQVIAKLDARLFDAAAEQARANRDAAVGDLDKARAKLDEAERQQRRAHQLAEQKLISQADLDTAETALRAAKAAIVSAQGNVAQATASYHQAKVNLGYTTIVSPINGVVISRNVDVGQTVAASLQAPTLFTIAEDLGQMQVHAAVSEADVGRLRPDMPATFVVDAYPDERFAGTIRQIRDAPQTLQNVVTYDAVIDVDNPDHRLKPGMTANVTFVYAERKGVLRIPTAALRFRPPVDLVAKDGTLAVESTGKKHKKDKQQAADAAAASAAGASAVAAKKSVWVLRDDKLSEVPIAIGVADGSKVEVRDGALAEGDVVVIDAVSRADRAEAKAKNKGLF